MNKTLPCPCGKTPTEISQYGQDYDKWVYAVPDCCGAWNIEYRSHYERDPDKQGENARDAWNDAPRGRNIYADAIAELKDVKVSDENENEPEYRWGWLDAIKTLDAIIARKLDNI